MKTYRYRIYYEWRGPSAYDIFAEEKTSEDLERAFERLPTELEMQLEDRDAVASVQHIEGKPKEAILTVSASSSENQLTVALEATLKDWRLFGTKLE